MILSLSFFILFPFSFAQEQKRFKLEGLVLKNWTDDQIELVLFSSSPSFHQYTTLLRKDNTFSFGQLTSGNYLLEVHSSAYQFQNILVEINSKSNTVRCFKGVDKKTTVPYPLILEPIRAHDYFFVREGFQIGSILKNPMMLMMGFSFVMAFLIPKMMGSLDTEALQQELAASTGQEAPSQTMTEVPPSWNPPSIESS